MKLLDDCRLETFYGASQALFGVDLDVAEGEVVALMGRNGMGKTTTIRSISQ
jgi:branched-chain amino acid transport system ATP-binding protein